MQSIIYSGDQLKILDQLKLPFEECYINVTNTSDCFNVIQKMQVRGAPAIALVALLSLKIEINHADYLNDKQSLNHFLQMRLEILGKARPTAINIQNESFKLLQLSSTLLNNPSVSLQQMKIDIFDHIESVLQEDLKINKAIGENGAHNIISNCTFSDQNDLTILTHCNSGSLATSGYGTALGVIRSLHSMKRLKMAYCTETRPYNQGSRLTSFELIKEEIPSKLICDNMVGALIKEKKIDAVIVGADRVAQNGDTANKIGTYQIAIIAKYHNVPFFVAAPISSIDFKIKTGKEIPIEERQEEELKTLLAVKIAPEAMRCWNPAFDVTPASLITGGIITEKGVFRPNDLNKLI